MGTWASPLCDSSLSLEKLQLWAYTLGLTKGFFLASAYRELSVSLVRGQGRVYNMCARLLARASGGEFVEGADYPYVD
jgi:hypothetical protein